MSRVTVCFERREDGGIFVYSDDVPGLALSSADPRKALDDVLPALEVLEANAKRQEAEVEDRKRWHRGGLAKRLREAAEAQTGDPALLCEVAEYLERNRYMSMAEEQSCRVYFKSWDQYEAVDICDRLQRAIEILDETNDPVVYYPPSGGIQVGDICRDAIVAIRRLRGTR